MPSRKPADAARRFLKGQALMLIRVGDTIINMDNVMTVALSWDEAGVDVPMVVFEFTMRGTDELEDGQNVARPYMKVFVDEEAHAIRKHLKKVVPNLLKE
jgi:hypothetical protein